MANELQECKDKLKKANEKLTRATIKMHEAALSVSLLRDAMREIIEVKEIASKLPAIQNEIEEQILQDKMLNSLKEASSAADKLRMSITDSEIQRNEAVSFLENFRNYRQYTFHGQKEVVEFLEAVFNFIKLPRVNFKQTVAGITDLSRVLKKIEIKSKKTEFEISTDKIKDLIQELSFEGMNFGYSLTSEVLTVEFISKNVLKVKSNSENIREFDSLCMMHGCTYSSD